MSFTTLITAALLQACSGGGGGGGGLEENNNGAGETLVLSGNAFELCLAQDEVFVERSIALADAVDGGVLYDKFWKVSSTQLEPSTDHPLWETRQPNAANTNSDDSTWRCKECHGWDYAGVDGAYGLGSSHYTGFKGLLDAANHLSDTEVFCAIQEGAKHSFADYLSDVEILDLTAFVKEKIIDTESYINANKTIVNGNVNNGAEIFSDALLGCGSASCHSGDGTLNVGDNFGLGELASDNPWEVFHKVRFGHPASPMPQFEAVAVEAGMWTHRDVADIIAFTQTLPGGGGIGGGTSNQIVLGGLLYDNHWSEREIDTTGIPTNPLFLKQTTNTRQGADTWRCKECHGWDYAGRDGAYGDPSNSHYTGFPSLLPASVNSEFQNDRNILFNYIKNGAFDFQANSFVHAFGSDAFGQPLMPDGPAMSDMEIEALIAFILDGGIMDTDVYFRDDIIDGPIGDAENGAILYNGSGTCASCHGFNGDSIPLDGTTLGGLARENPWEVLHKIRFGQPGPSDLMPSTLDQGISDDDAADIMFYSTRLP